MLHVGLIKLTQHTKCLALQTHNLPVFQEEKEVKIRRKRTKLLRDTAQFPGKSKEKQRKLAGIQRIKPCTVSAFTIKLISL